MSEEAGIEKVRDTNVNPFNRPQSERLSVGAVAIESERAIAEVQARIVIAKRFPRDKAKAWAAIMEECKRPGLAEEALYSYPRGGQVVSGPSIRLAEVLARCWGNIDFGLRELSRRDNETEMEAYAWDLETNTRSPQAFTVRHIRDTKGGAKALTDERDIYEVGANMGARRMRARILAIIPGDVVEDAVAQCRKTLEGGNDQPLADRVKAMLTTFNDMGISPARIESRLGHSLDAITKEEVVDLRGICKAIREKAVGIEDFFPTPGAAAANGDKPKSAAESLKDLVGSKGQDKTKEKPAEKAKEHDANPDLANALDRLTLAESAKEIDAIVKAAADWHPADQEPLIAAAAKRKEALKP